MLEEKLKLTTRCYDDIIVSKYPYPNQYGDNICYLTVNGKNAELTQAEAYRLIEALKEAVE